MGILSYLQSFLFQYQTPRVVSIRSRRIGITYRIIQLLLIIYLIGYVFLYERNYQSTESVTSSVVTKVKGTLVRNSNGSMDIWDSSDFVVPAQESNAFFITTNLIYTGDQTQGLCPEDRNVGVDGIRCKNDTECERYEPTPFGNGIKTGRCIAETGTCEIFGWCPTEVDIAPEKPNLHGFDSVTILVKNNIAFPKFNVKRRNILEQFSQQYLQTCRFHPVNEPLCPVFGFRDIMQYAGENLDVMAVKGGIIGIVISWVLNCNLDFGVDACVPVYSFRRLDNKNDKIAKGWNFRHSYYSYGKDGELRRDLVKYWGIRFVFLVGGEAGKFCFVNFILHVGSSLGLLGLASVVCEVVISYVKNDVLQTSKFKKVDTRKPGREWKRSRSADGALPECRYLWNELQDRRRTSASDPRNGNTRVAQVTPSSQQRLLVSRAGSSSRSSIAASANHIIDPRAWV